MAKSKIPLTEQERKAHRRQQRLKHYELNKDALNVRRRAKHAEALALDPTLPRRKPAMPAEERKARNRAKYSENPEPQRAQARDWHRNNPAKAKAKAEKRRIEKAEEIAAYMHAYYLAHRDEAIEQSIRSVKARSEERRAWERDYRKRKKAEDVCIRLASILRSRITRLLKGQPKTGSAIRDLGCSIAELREYLESLWLPGMSWENYGFRGWHVDHKKPIASFNLTDRAQFLEACHYTNLQPLWWLDNIKKGAKCPAN
jgi:hypothetical protein